MSQKRKRELCDDTEQVLDEKFAAFVDAERKNPTNRIDAISRKINQVLYLLEPCLLWEDMPSERDQEMCAFIAMNQLLPEACPPWRDGANVHYPDIDLFTCNTEYKDSYYTRFTRETRVFNLETQEFTLNYSYYMLSLKHTLVFDGSSWFYGIDACVDLKQTAQVLFQWLKQHIAANKKESHNGVVAIICHYVHYSAERNPFLDMVAQLSTKY